jgi:hypothetical protein
MDEKLKQQIDVRKDEAEGKNIEHKARTIAKGLGDDICRTGIINFIYNEGDFFIDYYNDPRPCRGNIGVKTQIYFKDGRVYEITEGALECYVPGEWERPFNSLYKRAISAEKGRKARVRLEQIAQKAEKDASKEAHARSRFGL